MEELWDDSVLINAFNSAISKYKDMHRLSGKHGKKTEGHALTSAEPRNTVAIEAADRFELEKGASSSVESPRGVSKEDSVVSPVQNGGLPSNNPCEGAVEHHADWVEYERQQISQQLAQLAAQREKLEQHLNNLDSMEVANTGAAWNGYSGGDYYSHYAHPYSADTCYYCQWNAYYNSVGAQTPSADFPSNGLQCQHCGFVNKNEETMPKDSPTISQLHLNESAFSEMARKAVSEAIKASDIKESRNHANFSDVAVAWFLAGFQTSRYLLQESDHKSGPEHEEGA